MNKAGMIILKKLIYIAVYSLIFGGFGFISGFWGMMILAPSSSQGVLTGFFLWGPLGLKIGVFVGVTFLVLRMCIPKFYDPISTINRKGIVHFSIISIILNTLVSAGIGFSIGYFTLSFLPPPDNHRIIWYLHQLVQVWGFVPGVIWGFLSSMLRILNPDHRDPLAKLILLR